MELLCTLLLATMLMAFLHEMYIAADIFKYIVTHGIAPTTYQPKSLFARFIKRATDLVIALIVCITVLPLLYIVLGIIIKLTSPGPVIFRHKRIGLCGKEFICYKFRSLYDNAGPQKVTENDERITPIGRFIRKTHLDEIPQFYNVLIGDMSLVGPRPLTSSRLETFKDEPLYDLRALVRPGIAGINQLVGRSQPQEIYLKIDVEYVCSQSWWQDIKILCKTLQFKDYAY